jgi:AcrR family transcriptional regulator
MTQHTRKRLDPVDRKEQILDAAISEARKVGYSRLTKEAIAQAAECSPALVNFYFSTMTKLRRALMRAAVKREVLEIIAQGLVDKNPQAQAASDAVKRRALSTLSA